MSANWDDSDSEDDNVEVVDTPVVISRSRQPSIAKSLEKEKVLDNSVAGSTKDEDSSEDTSDSDDGSDITDDEELSVEHEDALTLDFDTMTNMKKILSQFDSRYRNIMTEFADVEIFLISFDSLVVECAAHTYHNWQFSGQSLVLTSQIDRFLGKLVSVGGKFNLVVFTDFVSQFGRDTSLSFARAVALAHIMQSEYAKDVVFFTSPVDPSWEKFLTELMPSLLMISTDNVIPEAFEADDINITPQLETIAIDALSRSVPIVPFSSITVNFVSVFGYFVRPRFVIRYNWESFLAAHWDVSSELLKTAKNPTIDVSQFQSAAQLWAVIMKEAKATGKGSDTFDALCAAVLISTLVCNRRGAKRVYLPELEGGKRGLNVIRDRRLLLSTAVHHLERLKIAGSNLVVADLWDGRMISTIFDIINTNEPILPYRLQEEFAKLHATADLKIPLAVDTNEKLFEALPENVNPLTQLPILYNLESPLLKKFVPELTQLDSPNTVSDDSIADLTAYFEEMKWRLKQIEEKWAVQTPEVVAPVPMDRWAKRRANRQRQNMGRWYQMFSAEGGLNVLVDFARTPKGFATNEVKDDAGDDKKGKGWAGQKTGGGGKKGKEGAAKSKKEVILEANKKAKDNKVVEGEKAKIRYGTQQGKHAVKFLEGLYPTLDLPETKAICKFEMTIRAARFLMDHYQGADKMEDRRLDAVNLVSFLSHCFTKHWEYLDSRQKEQIIDIWVSLGFDAPPGTKPSPEAKLKKLDLGMNMVYYQLHYAGEIIDTLADPKKDDRVSGFSPDGWQRNMLDSVDRGNSALIIAPTSAGKTFISYYCIEKILRGGDDDVVVYVSPTKALINQVCGAIYARFRNKSLQRGKALFGVFTKEYQTDVMNCRVLVTIPSCLGEIIMSRTPAVQKFVSRIKHVIFDEVHMIGASTDSHVWEQLLLLIQCPFLALSATIGNAKNLHEWLNSSEMSKSGGKRNVDLILYGERYSELELSIVNIEKPNATAEEKKKLKSQEDSDDEDELITPLMPYGVFMPEKLRLFSIPKDLQMTARQILHLYLTMAKVCEKTKKEYEPRTFFGLKDGKNIFWINRTELRRLETALKERFLDWLNNDTPKSEKIFAILSAPVQKQLDYRSVPFNLGEVANENIVNVVDNMRDENLLPAICFNDDRHICEKLALTLAVELERRETEFTSTAEFKHKYEIKDEDKIIKLMKKKRDAKEKKSKSTNDEEEKGKEKDREEDSLEDMLAMRKAKLAEVLSRFRLRGRKGGDPTLIDGVLENLNKYAKYRESTRLLLRLIERGIGYHHDGLNSKERGAVESLFRQGYLAIVFSTATLSLGVNMPCKSVLLGVDTPQLTPLMYRQMIGRAGRRGFDHSGNVIFLSVPTSKIRRLLTASLSNLHGNLPYTSVFLLRMLAYVHQKDVLNNEGEPISTIKQRAKNVYSLLGHSFSLFTRQEATSGALQKQMRLYTAFSCQVLRHLQLITPNCAANKLADMAMYMVEHEGGTLAFIYLLQKGSLHQLLRKYSDRPEDAKKQILLVLAHLFTDLRVSPNHDVKEGQSQNYQISLNGLPDNVNKMLNEYNTTVEGLYKKFLAGVADDGSLFESAYTIGGSINADNFNITDESLVPPFFNGYSHDDGFLPVVVLDKKDHRGRKILLNAYAIDFYTHGSRKLLLTLNDLPVSQMWYAIKDFVTVLERLSLGLNNMTRPQDLVASTINDLYVEYNELFHKAFGMSKET